MLGGSWFAFSGFCNYLVGCSFRYLYNSRWICKLLVFNRYLTVELFGSLLIELDEGRLADARVSGSGMGGESAPSLVAQSGKRLFAVARESWLVS